MQHILILSKDNYVERPKDTSFVVGSGNRKKIVPLKERTERKFRENKYIIKLLPGIDNTLG